MFLVRRCSFCGGIDHVFAAPSRRTLYLNLCFFFDFRISQVINRYSTVAISLGFYHRANEYTVWYRLSTAFSTMCMCAWRERIPPFARISGRILTRKTWQVGFERYVGVGQEEMSWNTSVTDTDSSILRRMVTVGVVGERRTADVGCGLLYFTGEACCI